MGEGLLTCNLLLSQLRQFPADTEDCSFTIAPGLYGILIKATNPYIKENDLGIKRSMYLWWRDWTLPDCYSSRCSIGPLLGSLGVGGHWQTTPFWDYLTWMEENNEYYAPVIVVHSAGMHYYSRCKNPIAAMLEEDKNIRYSSVFGHSSLKVITARCQYSWYLKGCCVVSQKTRILTMHHWNQKYNLSFIPYTNSFHKF